MKHSILVVIFLLVLSPVFSQQKGPNISFSEESHSFGKILEAKGAVSHTFTFTNTGNEPLVIESVRPSCGCTTPEWSEKPIPPGGQGYVKATFNPANRPGLFNKTISVSSNAIRKNIILKFSGEVVAKEPTTEDKYPFLIDNIRFTSTYLSFGKVSPNKPATRNLDIVNAGNVPVTISFPSIPSHLEVLVSPATIKPNQRASIEFTYDAKKKNDWGFVNDAVLYTLNGKSDGKYRLNLTASIQDDYSSATPQQLANAPKVSIESNSFNFGTLKAGANIAVTFKFKNIGRSNLEIHKLVSSCGCTNVKAKANTIKPGAVGEISGTFSSGGQKGPVNKTITLITNDPDNLNLVLWIRGTVE
jgi:hypothetical protein